MNDAGYTLAETLAALLIIGLAFAGLTEGMRVIGLIQASTTRTAKNVASFWTAQDDLSRLMDRRGPFRSDERTGLVGDHGGFQFDCGERKPCGARVTADPSGVRLLVSDHGDVTEIALPFVNTAIFAYGDASAMNIQWPPAQGQRRLLRSILLVGRSNKGDVPIAATRLWREQEPGCQFDPIAQDCRAATP